MCRTISDTAAIVEARQKPKYYKSNSRKDVKMILLERIKLWLLFRHFAATNCQNLAPKMEENTK